MWSENVKNGELPKEGGDGHRASRTSLRKKWNSPSSGAACRQSADDP